MKVSDHYHGLHPPPGPGHQIQTVTAQSPAREDQGVIREDGGVADERFLGDGVKVSGGQVSIVGCPVPVAGPENGGEYIESMSYYMTLVLKCRCLELKNSRKRSI